MFLIIDPTGKNKFRHISNDVETAADIVLGITDIDEDFWRSMKIMEEMQFGDIYFSERFVIECMSEERYTELMSQKRKEN